MSITPRAGINDLVATGGTAVKVADGGVNGGRITNPLTAADQGLTSAEPLLIDPVGMCPTTQARGTIFALAPGESWDLIPGQTTATWVNAISDGHRFTAVLW